MIKKEFVNSFNRNYLKIRMGSQPVGKIRYQYQIISTRKLEGLLPVSIHTSNGDNCLYYDISSKQSLRKWFIKETLSKEWMDKFTESLKAALWVLEQYLLDDRNLLLDPDCIFVDMDTNQFSFLYCPYYIEEEKQDIEELLSLLLEKVTGEEVVAADAVFEIYTAWESLQEEFTVEMLLVLWEKVKRENPVPVIEEEPEESVREEEEPRKRDITDILFGWHKRAKEDPDHIGMAMEGWEYPEKIPPIPEKAEKTMYLEVNIEQEEKKLYGNGIENRKVISLEKTPLLVGKQDGRVDVILQDQSVSRMHARFTEEKNQIYMEDLNALNGTYKNGVRLAPYEKVQLQREDEIRLGNLYFTYR